MSSSQLPPAVQAMRNTPARPQDLELADLTQTQNTKNERSKILEYKATRPFAIREGPPYDLNLVAYEKFTNNLAGNNKDTYSLSNDIVDSPSIANDLVLYQGSSAVSEDSIDYANDQFDYTDNGTGDDLHAWYVVRDQALVQFEIRAPQNHQKTIDEKDAGQANLRNQGRDPLEFDFSDFAAGIVPTDWRLEVYANAPYDIVWSAAGGDATPDNALVTIPIRRWESEIGGLDDLVIRRIDRA